MTTPNKFDLFTSVRKFGQFLIPGDHHRIIYTPENLDDRRAIESYLKTYGYHFHTTIYGDIVISVNRNSLEISNLKSAFMKIAGFNSDKRHMIDFRHIPARLTR